MEAVHITDTSEQLQKLKSGGFERIIFKASKRLWSESQQSYKKQDCNLYKLEDWTQGNTVSINKMQKTLGLFI